MCETCTEAPGYDGDPVGFPCDCPCFIKENTDYLKFRPLICAECCHVAME
jgi:hypothetical protein